MATERLPSRFAKYSDGVAVTGTGRWIHVAGQIGMDDAGAIVPGGLAAQAEAAITRVEAVLGNFQAGLADVVKVTVFLTDLDRYAEFTEVRAARFGDALPASSAVQVSGLMLGADLELEAVAFVPDDRG